MITISKNSPALIIFCSSLLLIASGTEVTSAPNTKSVGHLISSFASLEHVMIGSAIVWDLLHTIDSKETQIGNKCFQK